jgi:N-acetyl sugar amidotransferase
MTIETIYDQTVLEKNTEANFGRPFQQCKVSVMDTIADPNITFDEQGICNYYYRYLKDEKKHVFKGEAGKKKLKEKIKNIKEAGKGKQYDCILGLSGGVDSTYLCLLAKEQGLRPLIVHFDNGWNSELAVNNIENTVKKLGFDLYTYVVDWGEFRELQLSYLKASVVDIEVLTDHAFMAVLYEQARKWKIKHVLAGMNIATEQVLPRHWIFNKMNAVNIKDIQSKYGRVPVKELRSFPFLNYSHKKYCESVLKMEVVTPLNFIDYHYDQVKEEIKSKLGWRDYGGKHYESVWTRFYQGFILPYKFNIDKRKAHFSNLIFSGQMTKEEALEKTTAAFLSSSPAPGRYGVYPEKIQTQQRRI